MRGKDVVLAVALAGVLIVLSQFLIPVVDSPATGQATVASSTICLNYMPRLNYSACNLTLRQNTYYACTLNATDIDESGEFTYYTANETGSSLTFNVTTGGTIVARPSNEDVGFNNVYLIVRDNSGCLNGITSELVTFEVINVNDPPVFVPPLGPFEWEQGEVIRNIFLTNYFYDPDGDPMVFSLSSLPDGFLISISDNNELIMTSSQCGEGIFTVTATDPFNASATSDPVQVSVPCTQDDSAPSGGGGGAGSSCEPNWQCSDWSRCFENGTQSKTCEDIAKCEDDVRTLWRNCTYIPQCQNGILDFNEEGVDCGGPCPACETCFDGIQNQGEQGVDCGGPCPTCQNCFDGIQNYGETGVDCGGPCPACPSCFDGIKNQNETGIDCGGPCPACTELQTPTPLPDSRNPLIPWIIGIAATLGVMALLYRVFYKQIHAIIARFILFFLRKQNKAILLTDHQRDELLHELKELERRNLLVNDHKEQRAHYQDAIGVVFRKMMVFILGPVFALEDAEQAIQERKGVSKLVRHLLHKQYIQLLSLEQEAVMSRLRLQLHTEIVRQGIFGYSNTTKEITAREVKAKSIKGSELEQVQTLLYNVALALQFGKVTQARQSYLQALAIYDGLTAPEQSILFGSLHLSFDMIRYVASYKR